MLNNTFQKNAKSITQSIQTNKAIEEAKNVYDDKSYAEENNLLKTLFVWLRNISSIFSFILFCSLCLLIIQSLTKSFAGIIGSYIIGVIVSVIIGGVIEFIKSESFKKACKKANREANYFSIALCIALLAHVASGVGSYYGSFYLPEFISTEKTIDLSSFELKERELQVQIDSVSHKYTRKGRITPEGKPLVDDLLVTKNKVVADKEEAKNKNKQDNILNQTKALKIGYIACIISIILEIIILLSNWYIQQFNYNVWLENKIKEEESKLRILNLN